MEIRHILFTVILFSSPLTLNAQESVFESCQKKHDTLKEIIECMQLINNKDNPPLKGTGKSSTFSTPPDYFEKRSISVPVFSGQQQMMVR